MSPELWERLQIVVDESLHLTAAERAAFLERACAGEPELRREVDSLLAGEEGARDFIEEPVFSLHPEKSSDPATPSDPVARRIGPYKLLSQVGSGGMGSVYLAARADDFEKPVALKILKRGMDTDEIVRRFEHERQILANLDHPYISKLLDGGTTEDGLPYFVMERVEGIPIDRYCDEAGLSTRQRLELFRKVCSAVHFAHQNLVVHRDLKPGNILVAEDGEPKLLDFGIAKLLESEMLSTQTPTLPLLTVAGTGPMTPRYASPEQVRGDAITTASDVYSLGVLLYRLLSGHGPYRLPDRSISGLFQAICDQDPIKPSDAVLLESEQKTPEGVARVTPESVSRRREGDARTLRRRLAGDLDCIVLKALRKPAKDRYGSVEQLSEDIGRHLRGLPVSARQGTLAYQAAKFFRRHSAKLAAVGAVLLIVLFGSLWRVSQNQAERQRERAAREQQISESLASLFTELGELDPKAGEDAGFAEEFRHKVAQYVDNLKLAEILNDQAYALEEKGGIQTAEVLFREALAMKLRLFEEDHPSIGRGMNNLATNLWIQGKYPEAEELIRSALELRIRLHGRESREAALSLNNLANFHLSTGMPDTAEPLIQESLEIREKLFGRDSYEVGLALNNLGFLHQLRGDFEAAESAYREAIELLRRHFGSEDRRVARVMRNLATVLQSRGDLESAEATVRRALGVYQKEYKHWLVADAESVLGGILVDRGYLSEAEPLVTGSYPVLETTKGTNAQQTREARERLWAFERARASAAGR